MTRRRKIVIRRMSILLTGIDVPIYGFISTNPKAYCVDNIYLLLIGVLVMKIIIVYIEYIIVILDEP